MVTPDGTVNVDNGTYAEDVTVSNPMTIEGESQSGVTVVPASGGGSMQNAFLVASSNVIIEDLTIDGKTNTSSTDNLTPASLPITLAAAAWTSLPSPTTI